MIVALDPASAFGVAHQDGYLATWRFTTVTGRPGVMLKGIHSHLMELLHNHPYDTICMEDATFGTPHSQVKVFHARIQGIVHLLVEHLKLKRVKLFRPRDIKRFATGDYTASKDQMIEAARTRLGRTDVRDDNQADALWILAMGMVSGGWKSGMVYEPEPSVG